MKKARPGFPEPRLIITLQLLVAITATATAAATAAAKFATTTASARALFARASDVDSERAPVDDRPVRREGVLEIVLGDVEGKISNKQFCTHVMFYCATNAAFTRLFPTIGFQIVTETSSLEDLPCRGIDKLSNSAANMNYSRRIATSIFEKSFHALQPEPPAGTVTTNFGHMCRSFCHRTRVQ